MPPEAQWATGLISAGGVTALAVIVWLTLRAHLRRMERREERTADAIHAFVEVLSRIEVRVGVDVPRRDTPARGLSVSVRRRTPISTDPDRGEEG